MIDTVMLSSSGGDVHAALTVADTVDKNQLTTLIVEGEICYSACAYIFLAGQARFPFGELGVHQKSSVSDSNFGSQLTASEIMDTLADYDVPTAVFVKMFETAPDEMYVFDRYELMSMGFFGDRVASEVADLRYENKNLKLEIAELLAESAVPGNSREIERLEVELEDAREQAEAITLLLQAADKQLAEAKKCAPLLKALVEELAQCTASQ